MPKNIVHDENKDQPQELFLDILFHCWQARHAFHRINLDEINLVDLYAILTESVLTTMNSLIVQNEEESFLIELS